MEKQEKNNSFKEIYEKLASSKKILMTLHKGPDGDSIGSCAAMKTFLENQGKSVTLISSDNVSENYEGFYFIKEIEFGKTIEDFNLDDFDVVLILDSGVTSQIKTTEEFLKTGFIINIDHHITNPFYGDLNYVDSEKPSTASVLMEFFETLETQKEFKKGQIISEDIATKLAFGVYTDSRGLTARNAIQALKDVNKLVEKGARYLWMIENMKTSLRLKKFYTYIINNMEYKDNIVWSMLPKEKIDKFKLTLSEVRTGIVELRSLKEFNIAFTLAEIEKGKIKVSFRSDSVETNVSKLAQELGGGGHKGAASAYLKNMNLEQAKEKVLEIIEKQKNK